MNAPTFNPPRQRHCKPCDAEWVSTDDACWLCGQPGELGLIFLRTTADQRETPEQPCHRCQATGLISTPNGRHIGCADCNGAGHIEGAA